MKNIYTGRPEEFLDGEVMEPKETTVASADEIVTTDDDRANLNKKIADLTEKLEIAEREAAENRDHWLRTQAELENLQRRMEREISNTHKYAVEKFAIGLLTVVDNLERSLCSKSDDEQLQTFYTGVELTLKSLLSLLAQFKITPQVPKLGDSFDAAKHTAMSTRVDPKFAAGTIVELLQKGYWMQDRLLRPALVVVAKDAE